MPRPEDCLYTKDHEWLHVEGELARVGITDFAQNELGDIVYVNMGEANRSVKAGDEMGEIESVKAVAQVYAPVAGEIVEINPGLDSAPDSVNHDPIGEGWLVMMKPADPAELKGLMDHAAYAKYLAEAAH
ncbi:MAG TPA: glycine cleavage system protein GcvH [Acidobacteriota bacterium]|nr:glycine cleavage system protein GcvH [bacterium]HNX18874.1 glycine cleavage system protein GcvH [Acidobacteriota bacterium]